MTNVKQIYLVLVLMVCALFSTAAAQDSTTSTKTALTITANATGDRMRLTAPASVAQMRLEVYAATGVKLFDEELRGANVFDWHLQDGQAARLPAGDYVCVVTAKTISGKITQKIGTVTVAEKSASVRAGDAQQFTSPQAQAIGPVETDSSWTIVADGETQTTTVIANTGSEGQMIRGRGALTFRLGDFFSGKDQEQMRLSEAGDLGIGTSSPRAKLDVAGTIRAESFLVAKPRTSNQAQSDDSAQATSDSVQPLVAGTGTQNRLAKWTDNAGTLGDSVITETAGGNIGIGTVSPGVALDVFTSAASTDLKVREASRTVDLSSNWTGGISGIGTLTNNKFGLAANGGIGILLDPSGNVGIGTNSPGVALDVVTTGAATDLQVREASRTVDISSNWTGGISAIGTTTNNKFALAANGSIGLTLNANGNVGIGTTTPASKLDVAGDINTSTQYKINGSSILSSNNPNTNLSAGPSAGDVNNGHSNSYFGAQAGFLNSTGSFNTFVGVAAGEKDISGGNNSFFGTDAGFSNQGGFANSFFGVGTGPTNVNGNFLTIIGFAADGSDNLTNATAIGNKAFVTQSNSLVLGSINGVNSATADTRVGIGTTAPAKHLHIMGTGDQEIALESSDSGGRQWTLQSSHGAVDGRFEIIDRTANVNRFTILSTGEIGIGTTAPGARLQVRAGDIYVDTANRGMILKTPDGTKCFRVTVDNAGSLTTSLVTCP